MNRLPTELHRLYGLEASGQPGADAGPPGLVDANGRVRAMVLALARPADWVAVSSVWQGVQGDLGLPAPAIAVSGTDAYQLWFSVLEPLPVSQARAFLQLLCQRYLGDIQPARLGLMPAVDAASPPRVLHAAPVPALQPAHGRWSAFVAPDLAPMFADEPWLDMPPNLDGQAGLLSRLQSIQPADLARALQQLQPAPVPPPDLPAPMPGAGPAAAAEPPPARWARDGEWLDPRRFLLDVMNDGAVALALRIEAAQALLQHGGDR